MTPTLPSYDDVAAASGRIEGQAHRTPVLTSRTADDELGARGRLTDLELDMFFLILSLAGSETTRNVISSGLRLLLDHPDDSQLAYRAVEWVEHNTHAFCSGYAEAAGRDPREDDVLLAALQAEKAVYEVVYETRMRPGWAVLPMAAIARLVG